MRTNDTGAPLPPLLPFWLSSAPAYAAIILVGIFAAGGSMVAGAGAVLAAAVPAFASYTPAGRVRREAGPLSAARSAWAVEVPAVLLLASTLVFRIRPAEQIAADPLDAAGFFRVASVGGAFALASFHLLTGSRRRGVMGPSVWLYVLYVLVVFAAAPFSAFPALTAYRGIELLTALLVVGQVVLHEGGQGAVRLSRVAYGFAAVVVLVVWLGAAIAPEAAFQRLPGAALGIRLRGAFNPLSANDVGMYGCVLGLWSAAKLSSASGTRIAARRWGYAALGLLGAVTVVVAQYRTGYAALAVGALAFVTFRSKLGLAAVLVA
ncbi:MAG: hypothetical protein ACRDIA_09225, partial [Actinomycetota bacterium]